MAKEIEKNPFDVDDSSDAHFEGMAKANGTRHWFARDLMRALGYDNWASFKKVINNAIGLCTTTNISVAESFIQYPREIDGRRCDDFKLTRFACCLIALSGDSKIPNVARAQVYFAALDQVVHDTLLHADNMERIQSREEITSSEISLSATAAAAGVEHYGRFQNAGYRGMYNCDLRELKLRKGIPDLKRSLLDFMGKEELSGNLFRLTLTEGRIKKDMIQGQADLEQTARDVGGRVRRMMIDDTGIAPESLPIGPDIKLVQKGLKEANKSFTEIDNLDQQRSLELQSMAQLPASEQRDWAHDCPDCIAGSSLSHSGSPQCSSGSIASGGTIAHCSCDYCAV